MHPPLPPERDEFESDQQVREAAEAIALRSKSVDDHWQSVCSFLEEAVNHGHLPQEPAEEFLGFIKHSIEATQETAWKTAQQTLAYGKWCEQGKDDAERKRRKAYVGNAIMRAKTKVNRLSSEEEVNALIASWDYSAAFEDAEEWSWEEKDKDHGHDAFHEILAKVIGKTVADKMRRLGGEVSVEVVRLERDEDGNFIPTKSSLEELSATLDKMEDKTPPKPKEEPKPESKLDDILGHLHWNKGGEKE